MIRFHCVRCKALYEVEDARAGEKFNCQPCGQRLEIPPPPLPPPNRTVLAPLAPDSVRTGLYTPPAPLPLFDEPPQAPLAILIRQEFPPAPPQRPSPDVSGLSLAAFALGLISFLIWLAFVPGVIACLLGMILGVARGCQKPGDTLAFTGFLLCAVQLLLFAVFLLAVTRRF